jgi:sugar O-acyltransferase (sialic acid O-acetyltransferase NeuD family)
MEKIGIYGTGGFAREVVCLLDDLGKFNSIEAFYEPEEIWKEKWVGKTLLGIPVLPDSEIRPGQQISIGIGASEIRERVVDSLPKDIVYPTLIHPNAIVSRWVSLDFGCVVCAGVIITCQINIGKQAQLNLQTTIGHDCQIGNYFTSAPSVNISGECSFGNHIYFGTCSAVRDTVQICDNVIIGMGAIVVKNINEPGTYIGIPAKKI